MLNRLAHFPQLSRATYYLAFLTIFLGALAFRFYGFNRPLADWHAWRQVDTASVTREFVKHGIRPLQPQYHDISNIPSGKFNPEGWRMVEFPLLNIMVATILNLQPDLPLIQTHRFVSIVSSMISLTCLVWLVRVWYGRTMSLGVALLFGFMPFSVYYSRVVLPEPFMVMWALLGAVALDIWARKSAQQLDNKQAVVIHISDLYLGASGVAFACALLVKPVALFFIPLYLAVAWKYRRWTIMPWMKAGAIFALAVVPLWWWRQWIQNYPEGIAAANWLLNSNGIRLRPAWWRWLFSDRIGRMMFGHWGASLLVFGGIATLWQWPRNKTKKQNWFYWGAQQLDELLQAEGLVLGAAAGALAFLVIFATGNVQHDYYQTVIVPGICLLAARGAIWLWRQARNDWQQIWMLGGLLAVGVFSWVFAWYDIQQLFNINNPAIVPAGEAVQRHAPADALVIAPYMGDTTLLFATDRRGWPIGFEIEEKRSKGAAFYLSTALDDETRALMQTYPVVEQTDLYTLIDLRQPLSATSSGQTRE